MEIRQKLQLKRLLIPELNQSLKILSLPLLDMKAHIENELLNNPFLEDAPPPPTAILQKDKYRPSIYKNNFQASADSDYQMSLITKKVSLQDILLRQLGMFSDTDRDFMIGQEIIGNIDENGYLKANIDEISLTLDIDQRRVEKVLKLIQQFEPAGVAAQTVSECLLIQLELANENDPLLKKIVQNHLDDIAKKNYSNIARCLGVSEKQVQPLVKMILRLDPKPGRNYCVEETQHVIPDATIYDKDEEFEISINDEDIPMLNINKAYKKMLKDGNVDPKTKEFLDDKLKQAQALLRAVARRKFTLRQIIETIAEAQPDAIL